MRVNRIWAAAAVFVACCALTGCADIRNIPPGHIGKMREANGWEKGIRQSGLVNVATYFTYYDNHLVICESSATTVKESFDRPSDTNPEDHRVLTADKVPLAVDLFVQVTIPSDPTLVDSIFQEVTARPAVTGKDDKGRDELDSKLFEITLEMIYDKFARMIVHGQTREIFAKYKNLDDVINNYEKVNSQIQKMVGDTFKAEHIPLQLLAAQISNIKPDTRVWEARNKQAAAASEVAAINLVGDAIRRNPGYIQKMKWDALKEIAGKGTNITVIEGSGSSNPSYTIPIR